MTAARSLTSRCWRTGSLLRLTGLHKTTRRAASSGLLRRQHRRGRGPCGGGSAAAWNRRGGLQGRPA